MKLLDFRKEIAITLCKIYSIQNDTTGRPSSSPSVGQLHLEKRKRGPTIAIPPTDVRSDNFGHFPTSILPGLDVKWRYAKNKPT